MSTIVCAGEAAPVMPAELEINGVLYVRAVILAGETRLPHSHPIPPCADVKAAFRRAVADKLATGENWNLDDIAQAKGCAVGTVRRHVGGILQEATPQKRKRGRRIYCTARSVAKYLGETAR